VQEALTARFHAHPQVRQTQPELEAALLRGELTAPQAARALLELASYDPKTRAATTPPC